MPGGVSGNADTGSVVASAKSKTSGSTALPAHTVYVLATEAGFNDADAKTMVAIGFDESGWEQTIVSKPNSNGTRDYGLFQINSSWFSNAYFKSKGWNSTTLLEGHANALAAHYIYGKQGFKAWSTYNHGLSAYALGAAKTSDQAGAAPDLASGIGNPISGITGAVTSAVDSVTTNLFKLGADAGGVIIALVLLVLGVLIIFHQDVGKAVSTVAKVVP